ncbi:hypothetical protein RFI_13699 [Reticulomyxa filosa]|uniref:Uncharacterized protein n=1 Tax=Reticulomyxa filosa TaxID=46433 RepID=X6NC60_RETFI|nr:hypothetical protein RFI_13699 [Reticulomyxa filosa]|eukprot:ETO23483.1 hypothetical protein RFI_13699 [Reticulomyxa filosa]
MSAIPESQQTQSQTEPVKTSTDQTDSDLAVLSRKHSNADSIYDVHTDDEHDRRSTFVVKEGEENKAIEEKEETEEFVHIDGCSDLQTRDMSMGGSLLRSRLVNTLAESNNDPMAHVREGVLAEIKHNELEQHVISNSETNDFQCPLSTQNHLDNGSATNMLASVVLTNSHCDSASKHTFDYCSAQTQVDSSIHGDGNSGDLESID